MTRLAQLLAAPALIAALAFAAPALAQTGATTPTLAANGEGVATVVPDIAIVTIGVTTRGATAAEALAANTADIAKVIATIQGEGVADKDIGTAGFSVFPVYQPTDPNNPPTSDLPTIVGYQVVNEVRVTIRDIATSGGILDKVVTAGANQVNGITFDIADRQVAADDALGKAIADARRQAEIMAKAAGVRLVRIINVNASSGGMNPVMARFEMAASMPVPVMPGQQEVRANASVTWEIAPE